MPVAAPVLVATDAPPPPVLHQPTTYVAFDDWLRAESEGPLSEWVDGEVITHRSASVIHQRLVIFLVHLIDLFALGRGLGQTLIAPAAMRGQPEGPGREPDLMFVSAARRDIVTDRLVAGAPDLVVEVVSDDSVARDRDEKYGEYEAAGVREYWIIDPRPERRRADFFVLDEAGRYRPVPVGTDGIYHSAALDGFWLNVSWLWADDLDPLAALKEIAGGAL